MYSETSYIETNTMYSETSCTETITMYLKHPILKQLPCILNVASITNGATGRQDRNLVSSISTWVASNFNSSSRTIITIYESVLEDVQSLKCSTNHVLNLYVRHTSQPCTAFTMCTLIDPLYLLEGLFLSLVRFLSIILDSH